jgi:hypothetical protein
VASGSGTSWPVGVLFAVCLVGSFGFAASSEGCDAAAYTSHPPIEIRGNDEFTSANGVVSGVGTPEDPFIIEGWCIDATGGWSPHDGSCRVAVMIHQTDVHFTIRDCCFMGTGTTIGILFHDDVSNGKVEDCFFEGVSLGIQTQFSAHNAIVGNRFNLLPRQDFANHCVCLLESSNTLVSLNSGAGRYGGDGNRNLVIGNTIPEGERSEIMDSSRHDDELPRLTTGNLYYHNNLLGSVAVEEVSPPNQWDNGLEGNYWRDEPRWDGDGDGINDIVVRIESGAIDRYPLMRPWQPAVSIRGVRYSHPSETITVVNWSSSTVDISNYLLLSLDGAGTELASYLFPAGTTLEPEEVILVASGDASDAAASPALVWEEGNVWCDWGGSAELRRPSGEAIDSYRFDITTGQ